MTSAATLQLFPAGTTIHPNPVSKGSLLFILRGAVALQKAPPSDSTHTPAAAQQASAQLRHSQQTTSSPGAVHVIPDQSPLPLLLQDPVDNHQSVGFTGSAAAAMHVPDAPAGINPQAAASDSQSADAQQWELVDDISRREANLVDSAGAQPTVPDNTGRSSEVLSVTAGHSQASHNCTTDSQPANISHTSGLVDSIRGQSASNQQSDLVDSAGGQSGLVDSAVGQSGRQEVIPEQGPAPISPLADIHKQTAQKDVLDARGCAFGLPGLMLGEPLDTRVAAKTVVEVYAVPWVLLQVVHTVTDSSKCISCNEAI